MRLYIIGLGVVGMFMMGCGTMQQAESPASTTHITASEIRVSEKAPALDWTDPYDGTKIAKISMKADHTNPWDGTIIETLQPKADHGDPWAPAEPAK